MGLMRRRFKNLRKAMVSLSLVLFPHSSFYSY